MHLFSCPHSWTLTSSGRLWSLHACRAKVAKESIFKKSIFLYSFFGLFIKPLECENCRPDLSLFQISVLPSLIPRYCGWMGECNISHAFIFQDKITGMEEWGLLPVHWPGNNAQLCSFSNLAFSMLVWCKALHFFKICKYIFFMEHKAQSIVPSRVLVLPWLPPCLFTR